MHLLVTRSALDAASLEAKLAAMGHETSTSPLIELEPVPVELELDGVQGLIATSRNALRVLGGDALGKASALPLFVVGPATGALARDLGFQTVIEGPAAARDLPGVIASHAKPEAGPLLHITGEDQAFDLKSALAALHFEVRQTVVYRARAAEALAPQVVEAIANGAIEGVVLMSPRTATIFSDLAAKAGVRDAASRLAYFCLSEAVAGALTARLAPSRVKIARSPNLQEMLALLAGAAPSLR